MRLLGDSYDGLVVIRGDVMVMRLYQDVVWGCLQDSSLEIGFVSEDEYVLSKKS